MADENPLLLMTRPRRSSEEFLKAVESKVGRSIDSLTAPVLEIEPEDVSHIKIVSTAIFTSINGVEAFDSEQLNGIDAAVVGARTARRAESKGARVVLQARTASEIVESIKSQTRQRHFLWARGEYAARDIGTDLRSVGFDVDEAVVYRQRPRSWHGSEKTKLIDAGSVVVPVFSPMSASLVVAEWPANASAPHVIAISPQVAEAWTIDLASLAIANVPDGPSMLEAVAQFFQTTRVVAPKSDG